MSSKRKQFKIYGPAHFRSTWERYKAICARDGTNMSEQIRIFVEGEVARRDPGNPQQPITAYVEGHDDQLAMRRSTILKELIAFAASREGELHHRDVVDVYRLQGLPGYQLPNLVESMEVDLKKLGVEVIY